MVALETDEQGRVTSWSAEAEELTGLPAAEVIGQPAWEVCSRLVPPSHDAEAVRRRVRTIVELALASGRLPGRRSHSVFRFRGPDGSDRVAEHDIKVVPSGIGYRFEAVVRDVTGVARAAEPQEDVGDHRLFLETFNGIAVYEIVRDEAGVPIDYRYLEVNPAFEELMGQQAAQVLGHTVRELMPDLEPALLDKFGAVALTGESAQFEQHFTDPDRHLQVRAFRSGRTRLEVLFQDVTELYERATFAESIIGCSGEGMIAYDSELRFVIWNPVMERLTGAPASYVLGKRPEDLFPDQAAAVRQHLVRALAGESLSSVLMEFKGPTKRGHGWFLANYAPHRDWQGKIVGVVASFRDVTDTHEAQETLRRSEAQFRAVFDGAGDGIAISRPGGRFVEVNQVVCDRLGYTRDELLAMPVAAINSPDGAALLPDRTAEVMKGGVHTYETTHVRRDGTQMPIELVSRRIEFNGAPAILTIHRDLTERKRADEAVREQARFMQQFLDAIPIPINAKDLDGRIQFANVAFAATLGVVPADVIGKKYVDMNPMEVERHTAADIATVNDDTAQTYEIWSREADGTPVRVLLTKAPLHGGDGKVSGMVAAAVNITDRYRAELALRRSEERFRALFEHAADEIFMWDPQGTFIEVNQAACDRLGYTRAELLAMSLQDLVAPELAAQTADRTAFLLSHGTAFFETEHVRKDGTVFPVELSLTTIEREGGDPAVLGIARDVSERRQAEEEKAALEEQLRQAQKMEEIGRLAGGIAHDFNNLLTAIRGNATLALADLPADSTARVDLEEIEQASDRAAALTRQLLAFARRTMLKPVVVDLAAVVRRLEPMLKRLLGEDISLVTVTPPSRGAVLADPSQIEQVIVNLVVNARDAMPDGGTLTIATSDIELDETHARSHPWARSGPNVVISVSDTGTGMTEDTLEHLFEPFFTTKGVGKGTGLGLATVYGIVRQSGGSVWATSELDRGSTFTVALPWVATEPAAADEPPPTNAAEFEPRTGTILVVEDDDGVRAFATRVLARAGYSVRSASGGAAALEVDAGGPIDLLLTDVMMPAMNGREVADRLIARQPGLHVLFMSGHADKMIVKHGVLDASIRYLAKPFAADDLLQAVAEALSADPERVG